MQAEATEAYRRNPYPPMVHVRNHPDRLATVARLAGMEPPDIRTANVLEIGVGNGLSLLSLAQAYPDARFTGFDIEAAGIADGNELRVAAGLTNVRLEVLDLFDTAGRLDEQYDYIIAHGVFAWVPPPVAEALLTLIGRHLSPRGVAMISFNALPGSYARQAIRDVMGRAAAGATSAEERLALGLAAVEPLATPRDDDTDIQRGFRDAAKMVLKMDRQVLIHDELGAEWHPRYLADVIDQARPHGLAFLGDIGGGRLGEAFVTEAEQGPETQAAVEARACAKDAADFCMFRRMLLIRADAAPSRVPRPAVIEALYASSRASEPKPGKFVCDNATVDIPHPALAAALRRLIADFPARLRVAELALAPALLEPLLSLYDNGLIDLHTTDAPYATAPGERPVASPLARAMIARGSEHAASLAHRGIRLEGSVADAVLALDGCSDEERFAAIIAEAGIPRDAALRNIAAHALLMPAR